jgi:hypothetical protein
LVLSLLSPINSSSAIVIASLYCSPKEKRSEANTLVGASLLRPTGTTTGAILRRGKSQDRASSFEILCPRLLGGRGLCNLKDKVTPIYILSLF